MAEKSKEWSYSFPEESRIIKQGNLKKLKNKGISKKRYFVIWTDADTDIVKLAYFDSEKKFRNKSEPNKPPIVLKKCFNINKTADTKHKFVIALYTEDDCLGLVAESEQEQESWLNILCHHHCGELEDGEPAKAQFEHVWQVKVKEKGLGGSKIPLGPYRLCLTDKTVGLVKVNHTAPAYVFQLQSVRRYGHTNSFFHMEVGRHAVTGQGELWMDVEDPVIAQNVHETILNASNNLSSEPPPPMRQRSSTGVRSQRSTSSFRPRTKSDSKSNSPRPLSEQAMSLRTGSRSPVNSPRSLSSLQPINMSGDFRDRSDSIDSRGTSSGMSTDNECEPSPKIPSSRTRTPEHGVRSSAPIMIPSAHDSQSPYVDMDVCKSKRSDNYMDMSPINPGVANMPLGTDDPYMSMTPTSMSSSPAVSTKSNLSEDAAYLEMAPMSHTLPTVQEKLGYMDMKPGSTSSLGTSPQPSAALRPNKGYSYLIDNDHELPKRHYSVGSRPNNKLSLKNKSYMEAMTKQGMLDASKSCSAPHLIPQNMSPVPALLDNVQEHFMEMEFSRPRTGSDVGQMMRPRTSSWTQYHRPRASSHGQKAREKWSPMERQKSLKSSSNRSSSESLKSQDSRKLSSESLTKEGYLDMSFHHTRSNSQPVRQNSGTTDYMCMSPTIKNDKIGTGNSKRGDYVPMNPPQGTGKMTAVEYSSSPRQRDTSGYMEMSPSDFSQGRRSSVGSGSRKVPVFKLTSAVSSDSDSSTSGCHSSHSDLACPSPSFGQSAAKGQPDTNSRGSQSQSSGTDESGTYMNLNYDTKSEQKNKEVKKDSSDIPDSYMPIVYDQKKDAAKKTTESISEDNVPATKGKTRKVKETPTAPVVDSYMTFAPGASLDSRGEMGLSPEKVTSYVRNPPPPPPTAAVAQDNGTKKHQQQPPKKATRRKPKPKLVSCDGPKTSDNAMMQVASPDTKLAPRKSDMKVESSVKKVCPPSPLSPLSVTVAPSISIPRRSSASQLSDGESGTPKTRRSITEPLPSPCRSTSSRHSSGASTSTGEQDVALNYASLDLSDSMCSVSMPPKSPRNPRTESGDSDSPLMYSQIDFEKSEALKAEPPKLRENRTSFSDLK